MNNEDIKVLEEFINRCKECKFATCEQCEINWKEVQAIENLINRNKELEDTLNDLVQVKQDVGSISYTMPSKLAKASIEVLVNSDLKMKNKKLQEKIKEQQKQLNIANKKILSQKGQLKVVNTSYIPKSKVREMKDKLLKEYKCAEEGFMKKQIPTSVVDGTIVQELGWILQEIDKLLQKGDINETEM